MKAMVCEMCGGNDLIKQDGVYVCQNCGVKYSLEEAKKLLVEGVVKIDHTDELKNLYEVARRAKNDNNSSMAASYYEQILTKDPRSWEAAFYSVYFKSAQCKIAEIRLAGLNIGNCLESVLKLIKMNVENEEQQKESIREITSRCTSISSLLYTAAANHYLGIDPQYSGQYAAEFYNKSNGAIYINFALGSLVQALFGECEWGDSFSMRAFSNGKSLWNSFLGDIKPRTIWVRTSDHITAAKNAENLISSYDVEIEKINKKQRERDIKKQELKRKKEESEKKQEELKEQYTEEYGLVHSEEKDPLEEAKNRIEELKKENAAIPEREELRELYFKESELKKQLSSIGIFQGKKKKMLQEEIDLIRNKCKPLYKIVEEKAKSLSDQISEQEKIIKDIMTIM